MDAPRWHLRFANFEVALGELEEALALRAARGLSKLEEAGTIKQFELTWELSWKLLRDFVADTGTALVNPSTINAIRAGLSLNLIENGDAWIAAMKLRNSTTHEYGREHAQAALATIAARIMPLFENLRRRMSDERG